MKVYSIGRDPGCDILVNDPSGVISRRHALITVSPNGKITLTDTSHNGTYVNGVRITPNEPVPVTRKDSVTFAHVAKMDWKIIPTPPLVRYAKPAIAAIAVVAITGIGCAIGLGNSKEEPVQPNIETSITITDSIKTEKTDTTKQKEKIEKTKKTIEKEKTKKVTKKAQETKDVEKTTKIQKVEPKEVEKKKVEEKNKDVKPANEQQNENNVKKAPNRRIR